jgi:methyl-accepting chemotaxis protein
MKALKLWQKMALGFGGIIILMIIGGIMAVNTASKLSDLTTNLYRHPLAVSTAIRDIKTDLMAIHRSMKDVAMAQSIAQLNEAQKTVDAYAKYTEASFATLNERFLGDKSDINDAQQLFEDWVPIRQKVIEQSAIQLNNNANEVTRTEGAPHIAKIMRSLDGLIRFANSKAKEFTQTAQTSGSKANAAILVGKFYRHPFAVSTTAMEIQAAVYGILINMKDLSVAPSAEKVNIIRNEIDGKIDELRDDFALLKERFLGDKREIDAAEKLIIDWKPIRDKVIKMRLAQVTANPGEITRKEGAPHLAKLNGVLDGIKKFADDKAVQFNANANKEASSSITLLIILFSIASIIGLIAGYLVTRNTQKMVGGEPGIIALIATDVAAGKFDIEQSSQVTTGIFGELAKMATSLKDAITSISGTMNGVSQGDFTNRINGAGMNGEMVLIKDSINNSMDMLSDTIAQVVVATDQVNSGATQISVASQSLAAGTSEQAASLEEISSSMSEVGSRANASNDNANQAAQLTTQAMEIANRGNEQMKEMLSSMDKINSSSADISKIIKVIDEIAFQTNLLALNAAVEAARAGKYGKGFAVVAEEVRNLAARSAEAAKNTTELIENSIKEVDSGVSNAGKTAEILKEINEGITKVNDLVGEIAADSQEQSNSTDEINKSLTQVNEVVQQNASISEEAASASEELSGQALQLQALMARFKLNQTTATTQQSTPIQQKVPAEIIAEKAQGLPKMITLDDDDFGKY